MKSIGNFITYWVVGPMLGDVSDSSRNVTNELFDKETKVFKDHRHKWREWYVASVLRIVCAITQLLSQIDHVSSRGVRACPSSLIEQATPRTHQPLPDICVDILRGHLALKAE